MFRWLFLPPLFIYIKRSPQLMCAEKSWHDVSIKVYQENSAHLKLLWAFASAHSCERAQKSISKVTAQSMFVKFEIKSCCKHHKKIIFTSVKGKFFRLMTILWVPLLKASEAYCGGILRAENVFRRVHLKVISVKLNIKLHSSFHLIYFPPSILSYLPQELTFTLELNIRAINLLLRALQASSHSPWRFFTDT